MTPISPRVDIAFKKIFGVEANTLKKAEEKGVEKGLLKGREEGVQEGIKITGLSSEEIQKLKS